jgi:preprotein translocase subunit SecE
LPGPPSRPVQRQRPSLLQYLREVRNEMIKVAWPTRAPVLHNAAVYLGVIVIVTVMIASIDVGVAALVRAIGG